MKLSCQPLFTPYDAIVKLLVKLADPAANVLVAAPEITKLAKRLLVP